MRLCLVLLLAVLASCSALSSGSALEIPYQKHVLDNGLEVVLHEDRSDPVVAVYVQYHVGSAREEAGRSGFAHLFEHMLFQGSQHVGDDMHFKLVQEAGGTLNGSTTRDRTNYFEVLPSNQLELALWLEADRMGWFTPSVTQAKLDNQREVVKNERRQNYENRPYGMARAYTAARLYPPEHPYHWLTIGSQEDLNAASIEDVLGFFGRWYGPNNATLAIGGDIDPQATLELVRKYFGNIPRGPLVEKPAPRPVMLAQPLRIAAEDSVKLPQLSLTWPSVPMGHADEAALDMLGRILAMNDTSVLDRALRIEAPLCADVSAAHNSDELAGEFLITLRANPGVKLDELHQRVLALLAQLAEQGIDADALERVKGRYEAEFLRRAESVGMRTGMLANLNCFTREPGSWRTDLDAHLAVTPKDLQAALRRWIAGRPELALSIVPRDQMTLALKNSAPAPLIGSTARPGAKLAAADVQLRTPPADTFDRSLKPSPAASRPFRSPPVWHDTWPNGIPVTALPYRELPLAVVTLSFGAGQLAEADSQRGISTLTAGLITQGTQARTALELQGELDRLGATLSAASSEEELILSLNVPERNLEEAALLLSELVRSPRFAAEDFERLCREQLVALGSRSDQIRLIADDVFRRLLHGEGPLASPGIGTQESLQAMRVEDVAAFWQAHANASTTRVTYVGARDASGLRKCFAPLLQPFGSQTALREVGTSREMADMQPTRIYLVDKPGAAQSELRIGHMADTALSPRSYALSVLNQPLGGQFSSRINLNLREDKGYTYGARTAFESGRTYGRFLASAAVQTEKIVESEGQPRRVIPSTSESVAEFLKEIRNFRAGPTDAELAFTKDALLQGALRQYESIVALSRYASAISTFGYPDDFAERRLAELQALRREDLVRLAQAVLHPDRMIVLVVGDKAKVRDSLRQLGLGEPIELDSLGRPLPTTGQP
jgi:zinc protease